MRCCCGKVQASLLGVQVHMIILIAIVIAFHMSMWAVGWCQAVNRLAQHAAVAKTETLHAMAQGSSWVG
jgi:hypothetical protein